MFTAARHPHEAMPTTLDHQDVHSKPCIKRDQLCLYLLFRSWTPPLVSSIHVPPMRLPDSHSIKIYITPRCLATTIPWAPAIVQIKNPVALVTSGFEDAGRQPGATPATAHILEDRLLPVVGGALFGRKSPTVVGIFLYVSKRAEIVSEWITLSLSS